MPSFSLKDRVILLTGGTGLYGRGLTADLAQTGARLIIASRNLTACQAVADEENAQPDREVHAESYDQSDESSIISLKERIYTRFGRLDGLVNNAVARPGSQEGRTAGAQFAASMQINATGLFLMHHHFGDAMTRQHGGGSIVNVGSIYGIVGPHLDFYEHAPTMFNPIPDYFYNKAGMTNLTRFYANLFGPKGVRVNTVSPGGFFNHQDEHFVKRYTRETSLGRMGDASDLGGPVIFLLSEAARYVTGVNLPVDGGFTAR